MSTQPNSLRIRVGDRRPYAVVQILDGGTVVDLTDSTAQAVLTGTDGTVIWTHPAAVSDGPGGIVTYPWGAGETDTAGEYLLSFRVSFSDGTTQTFPVDGGLPVSVLDAVAETEAATLLITPESVARRLGLSLPLSEDDREDIITDIVEAQADIEAYLGRPIIPRQFTERLNADFPPGGYSGSLLSATPVLAWPVNESPVLSVDSVVDDLDTDGNPTGFVRVTYTAGYDARTDSRFAVAHRYVRQAAITGYRTDHALTRTVRSSSVEGQSVTYDAPFEPTRQTRGVRPQTHAGGLPALESLSRFRKRGVFSRPRVSVGLSPAAVSESPYTGDVGGVFVLGAQGVIGWDGSDARYGYSG